MVNFDLEDGNLGLKPFQLMILRFSLKLLGKQKFKY